MLSRVSNGSVVVIDDDPAFLESLGRLLRSEGLYPRLFTSIAGLRSPNHRIVLRGFTTGHCDISMTVEAMKAGAIEFLTKPFRGQDLLDAVNVGLARDRARREDDEAVSAL
jgi:FixJ family two-component response regulator